ncbi:MAG: hypothetical protein K2X29_14055 [Candidatus Obscuribacterales bacterium]|nr:hypothetical protein [Candidatus Obscuribacterales bacterium]
MSGLSPKSFLLLAFVTFLFLQLVPAHSFQQQAESATIQQIDDLTEKILLKEIELERFTLHYTLESAKQGRWKGWRYASFQEVNSGLGLSGSIISVVNRGSVLHDSSKLNVPLQEAANYIPMIGSIIGASAAAAEFGINSYHDIIARKHGFSPAASLKRVKSLKDEIQSLLAERQKLVDTATASDLDKYVVVFNIEGKVLRDMLEQSLQEFSRYHVGARRLLAFQQTQYLFDVAKFTTNAIGLDFAYLSLHRRQRIWNGRAGVLFAVAGQLTIVAPILSRLVGWEVSLLTKKRIKRMLPETQDANIARFQADLAALDKVVKERTTTDLAVASVTDRQGIFDVHEKSFSNAISAEEKKLAAAKLTATENVAASLFVGGAKTAGSVLFLIPGYDNRFNSKTKRAGKVTNELLFSAGVVGIPTNSFSMLDTLRIQVQGEIHRHKAMKDGKLPAQIAAKRLKELDDIERALKTN